MRVKGRPLGFSMEPHKKFIRRTLEGLPGYKEAVEVKAPLLSSVSQPYSNQGFQQNPPPYHQIPTTQDPGVEKRPSEIFADLQNRAIYGIKRLLGGWAFSLSQSDPPFCNFGVGRGEERTQGKWNSEMSFQLSAIEMETMRRRLSVRSSGWGRICRHSIWF